MKLWPHTVGTIAAILLAAGCSSGEDAPAADASSASESLPPGQEVDGWWIHDEGLFTPGGLGGGVTLSATNVDEAEKSTSALLSFIGSGGEVLKEMECLNLAMTAGSEFAEPNDTVQLSCAVPDGDVSQESIPAYDEITIGVIEGFPTSQEERDEMGY